MYTVWETTSMVIENSSHFVSLMSDSTPHPSGPEFRTETDALSHV